MLFDIPCPENLSMDYVDMTPEQKKEWFEYTYFQVFKDAAYQVVEMLGRELTVIELNLIRRRILNYLKENGFEYERK